jgi:hypothetical protein
MLVMPQLGANLQHLVLSVHDIMENCVHGDALAALRSASHRLMDMDAVGGHFLANGADIVSEMSDAVEKFEGHRLHAFGMDIGAAARKVLLSNSTDARLPEGLPGKAVLANVSEGLLDGFFGEGMAVDIHLRGMAGSIHIDLHECLDKNLKFFQSVWSSTMFLFAQKDADKFGLQGYDEHGKHRERAQFMTALAFTMMQVPKALRKCSITPEQEEMFMDSLKAFGAGTSFHFDSPVVGVQDDVLAVGIAETMKAWSQMKWYAFGYDLGKLMQVVVSTVFPQKYSVSQAALVRNQFGAAFQPGGGRLAATAAARTAGCAFAAVLGLAVVASFAFRGRRRTGRAIAAWKGNMQTAEAGGNGAE